MPRPIRDDRDAIARMKALAARLRELNCPLSAIPADVLAEDKLLKQYIRKRVGQQTAAVDQAAAAVLDSIDDAPQPTH